MLLEHKLRIDKQVQKKVECKMKLQSCPNAGKSRLTHTDLCGQGKHHENGIQSPTDIFRAVFGQENHVNTLNLHLH